MWRLIAARFVMADGGAAEDIYGATPSGLLAVTEGGRLIALIHGADDFMSYSGVWRLEGEGRFVTRVDMAWRDDWIGSDQGRTFRIDGDRLFIASDEVPHPIQSGRSGRGLLDWRRHPVG